MYETPLKLFIKVNKFILKRFGREVSLDACATKETAKCERFFDEKTNGLTRDWRGNVVFCNPPYIDKSWIGKCYREGQKEDTIVIALLPVRADTELFHDYIMKAHDIWFLKGRVWFFLNGIEQKQTNFASMLVIFKKTENSAPYINSFFHKEKDVMKESNMKLDGFLEKK